MGNIFSIFGTFLLDIFDYIGSAMPLAILCFMIVFIFRGKKIKGTTIVSYCVMATIMFLILLRTK